MLAHRTIFRGVQLGEIIDGIEDDEATLGLVLEAITTNYDLCVNKVINGAE